MKTKSELLKLKFITNKFTGSKLEILHKDPYGFNAPNPINENYLFIRDAASTSSSFFRGSYATLEQINYIL